MKFLLFSSLFLSLTSCSVIPRSEKIDYSGFKVVRLSNAADLEEQIEQLAIHVLNPGRADLDVVVSPENLDAVVALVSESTVITEDLGAAIAEEGELVEYQSAALEARQSVPSSSWFTAYHPYADHLTFLRQLQAAFPARSEIVTAGSSVQGRVLTGIHIYGSGGPGSRPAVLFHGTVHAREWIATMTTEYLAYQLLTRYDSDSAVRALVERFDFYIMPIINPDGFYYTQTTDRLWRKNRQTVSTSSCVGRDINRNWPYQWSAPGGASTNPCSETFKGLAAADAPETQGIVAQVNRLRDARGIRLYIDIHSYAYGYDCSLRAENEAALRSLATAGQSAIGSVYGTPYTIGPSCSTLYATTGDSVDYLDATGQATYSYTIELRDRGNYGFVLPATQIQPTVAETWAGVLAMLQLA